MTQPSNFIDMTGQIVGRWMVLGIDEEATKQHSYFDGKRKRRRVYWKCQCTCKNHTVKSVLGQNLRNGRSLSCGCLNKERDRTYERLVNQIDLTGQTINNIYVVNKDQKKHKNRSIYWNCKCLLCGSNFVIDGRTLRKKDAPFSCGCIKSKGEFQISQLLEQQNFSYIKQYQFVDLPNRFFDFALCDKENNVYALIEYDGEQHFNKNSKYYSEEMIEHDKQKNNYCIKNNIKLYRIPYWEYDNLQNIYYCLQDKFLVKGNNNYA